MTKSKSKPTAIDFKDINDAYGDFIARDTTGFDLMKSTASL